MSGNDVAIFLKVSIPALHGFKTRKFSKGHQVKDIIESLNKSLPPKSQCELYNLYCNGKQLDPHKTLGVYNLQHMDLIELKRAPLYHLTVVNDHSKTIFLEDDVRTSEAIRRIGEWLFPSDTGLNVPTDGIAFRLHKKVRGGIKQELMDLKELCSYGILTDDILEMECSSPKGIQVVELIVSYSPLSQDSEGDEDPNLIMKGTKVEHPIAPKKDWIKTKFSSLSKGKKAIKRASSTPEEGTDDSVGLPYNVIHKVHVDFNWTWSGEKPEDLFEMQELLGQGAYGQVWLATHRETGFTVAIKQIAMEHSQGKKALEKEIEVLRKCKSPNILSYYGCCSRSNEVWILMDYCAAGSVKDLITITLEPLEEHQIAEVCAGVVKGLAYLHAQNIIHLDVKAANIMLTEEGQVKLGDFGVSEPLRKATLTSGQRRQLVGSPLYMAPEVIKKENYNSKADIWSLGITLVELAEGRPPNNDISSIERLTELLERSPPTLKQAKLYSEACNNFLAQCLTIDPEQRPSAFDLLNLPFVTTAKGPRVLKPLIRTCVELKKDAKSDDSVVTQTV